MPHAVVERVYAPPTCPLVRREIMQRDRMPPPRCKVRSLLQQVPLQLVPLQLVPLQRHEYWCKDLGAKYLISSNQSHAYYHTYPSYHDRYACYQIACYHILHLATVSNSASCYPSHLSTYLRVCVCVCVYVYVYVYVCVFVCVCVRAGAAETSQRQNPSGTRCGRLPRAAPGLSPLPPLPPG